MNPSIAGLSDLLSTMWPVRNPGVFVFTTLPAESPIEMRTVIACIREPEGMSVVLAEVDAVRLGLPIRFRSAWLTLRVPSELNVVGFTATFSAALARAGISCNVVAGTHHDHIFVPHDQADAAVAALVQLQLASGH